MRLKFKPWANKFIQENNQIFLQSEKDMNNYLQDQNKIAIELGCGKGNFICQLAKQNPYIKYIAIERYESVIVEGGKKLLEAPLDNLKFYAIDVNKLANYQVLLNKVDIIYLNFSDPWPKKKHEKRRLTSKGFLEIYAKLLKDNGHIEFKTDNQALFEYSLESFVKNDYMIQDISLDLHNTLRENIKTEYENKFSQKGFRINYLKAIKRN